MALVNQPAILPGAFAAEGDKNTIPANNDGLSGLASVAKGFPPITQVPLAQGGQPPQRQDFNGIFNLFSQFLLYAQNGGVYAYNNTLDYQPPCIISYNGEFYSCIAENGPSTSAGVQAPTIATYWEKVIVNSVLEDILSAYAELNSPAFSGVPTVPTADAGTNTTQIASTAFVKNALSGIDLSNYALKSDLNAKANINSPALTGTPTSTTPASSDNSTRIATTAFVKALVGAANNGGIVSANLAQNGYVKFANGFILQWGEKSSADIKVALPITFTTTNYVVVPVDATGNTNTGGLNLIAIPDNKASFSAYTRASDVDGRWSGWQTSVGIIGAKWLAAGF